jgi:hypothetical protein
MSKSIGKSIILQRKKSNHKNPSLKMLHEYLEQALKPFFDLTNKMIFLSKFQISYSNEDGKDGKSGKEKKGDYPLF